MDKEKLQLKDAIKSIASISFRRPLAEEAPRFFRVTMINVQRFHSDVLMSIKKIKTYLQQVSPLPYASHNECFSYGEELDNFFSQIPNFKTYNISLNGEKLSKPYSDEFEIGINKTSNIKKIKKLTFTNSETGEMIGLGWFAITPLNSSLPKSLTMRGIRVKHGNIEVGDDRFLDHIYAERRFATWHIGEIHLNHNIKPNARRDGFEQSKDYECFLERAAFIGKALSKLCRQASINRCANQRAILELSQVEKVTNSTGFIFNKKHKQQLLNTLNTKMDYVSNLTSSQKIESSIIKKADVLREKIKKLDSKQVYFNDYIDGRKIEKLSKKDLIKRFSQRIIDLYDKDQPIEETLKKALKPYLQS